MPRTTTEILQDHLAKRLTGDVESDIEANFAEDILILSTFGVFHGHDGVRDSAARLSELLGDAVFHYTRTLIEKDFGYLEWTGESDNMVVRDGADSFVIRDEKICFQAIHYTARDK